MLDTELHRIFFAFLLFSFITRQHAMHETQSGYSRYHSTETVATKVYSTVIFSWLLMMVMLLLCAYLISKPRLIPSTMTF